MALILDGSSGVTFPAGGVGNTVGAGVGTTDSQTLTNKTYAALAAGTASTPPIQLTSSAGTIMTTPTAGAIEYDGSAAFISSYSNGRGVLPGVSLIALTADSNGLNSASNQSLFGQISNTSWNVPNTDAYYAFEMNIGMFKTAGATSHTINLLFGGSATVSNIMYRGSCLGVAGTSTLTGLTANAAQVGSQVTTIVQASAALANAACTWSGTIYGYVNFTSTGTFIPQYKLSTSPGGAYTTVAGSYFKIWSISQQVSSSAIRVGNWA